MTYKTEYRDPAKWKQQCRDNARKRRAKLIAEMGGKCICCGETTFEFLQFDHVNDDGAEHRRQLGRANLNVSDIRRRLADFQLLCANCNFAKGTWGVCSHQLLTAHLV
jgi:hypothetical protein